MGTVLALTRGLGGVAALALLLGGCAGGTAGGDSTATSEARALAILGRVESLIPGARTGDGGAARPRADFSEQAIAADPGAYRLVQIASLGLVEPARVIQANGDEVTIELQSGRTAAFDGGVLVATRGFGDDLQTFGSAGVREALRAGGGSVARRLELLDSEDQIRTVDVQCSITPAGPETVDLGLRQATLARFDEHCQSSVLIFDNIYWLDGDGSIAASQQYVSPGVAYLRSNRL